MILTIIAIIIDALIIEKMIVIGNNSAIST